MCSTHGASSPCARSEANAVSSQSRAEIEQLARELGGALPAEPPHGLQPERRAVARPELRAEHAEREVGVREELAEQRVPGVAVAGVVAVELGGVRLGGAQQERALAVGV